MQSIPTKLKDHPVFYQILRISPPGSSFPAPAGGGHVSSFVSLVTGHLTLFQCADAPNNEKPPFGACESNVESPPISEKSNLP